MLKFFKKIKFLTIFWILFYFLIFSLLLRGGFAYLDPDLGWHLRVGQEISTTLQVPSQNIYNYTYTGNWVDHEWLSNYLIFQIYNNLGYPTLVIFFAIIIILVLVFLNLAVNYIFRKEGKESPVILIILFQLLGVVAISPHLGVRIQEFALLFLLVCFSIIYVYNNNQKWKILLLLIPLFYLWACLHASFLIGIFILFAWAGIKLFEKIISRSRFKETLSKYIDFSQTQTYRSILIFTLFSTIAVIATFFTPYYWKLYSFLGGYGNTLYMSYIQEWFSQFIFPFYYWQLFLLSMSGLAFFIYIFYAKRKKIDLWTSFIFLLFFILSFKSRRHLPLFFVMNFVFIIKIYSDCINIKANKIGKIAVWLKAYLIFCLFLTCISVLISMNYIRDPFFSKYFSKEYPVNAVTFINNNYNSNVKIFNDYGWGGYMIYRNPERKIFIDGRLPQVLYKNHSFLEEYLAFYGDNSKIEEKLSEYEIELVLIKTKRPDLKAKNWEKILFSIKDNELISKNNFRDYLNENNNWSRVYTDETSIIYKKN